MPAVKCNVAMGKQDKEFWFLANSDAPYHPEIIAKYYTQQYLIIVEREISKELVKNKINRIIKSIEWCKS